MWILLSLLLASQLATFDVNHDGLLDGQDVQQVRWALEVGREVSYYDFNADGVSDADDLALLQEVVRDNAYVALQDIKSGLALEDYRLTDFEGDNFTLHRADPKIAYYLTFWQRTWHWPYESGEYTCMYFAEDVWAAAMEDLGYGFVALAGSGSHAYNLIWTGEGDPSDLSNWYIWDASWKEYGPANETLPGHSSDPYHETLYIFFPKRITWKGPLGGDELSKPYLVGTQYPVDFEAGTIDFSSPERTGWSICGREVLLLPEGEDFYYDK